MAAATRDETKVAAIDIEVWRVPLDQPAAVVSDLAQCLSEDERATLKRRRVARDRDRAIVARAAQRRVLARILHTSRALLRFEKGHSGKPLLPAPHDALQFSVSHSEGLALIAVAEDCRLGVDLEQVKPRSDLDDLAAGLFSPVEAMAWRSADDSALRHLYAIWTCKEAYLKAIGSGLAVPLRTITVSLADPPRLAELPTDDPARWSLVCFEPAPGYVAALAAEAERINLSMHEWTP